MVKDYDITILYHPGKANMVVDALSRKAESLASLAYLRAAERPLALDVQVLSNQFVRLDISEPSRVLAYVVSRSSLYDRIRERQYDNPFYLSSRTQFSPGMPRRSLSGMTVCYGCRAGYVCSL